MAVPKPRKLPKEIVHVVCRGCRGKALLCGIVYDAPGSPIWVPEPGFDFGKPESIGQAKRAGPGVVHVPQPEHLRNPLRPQLAIDGCDDFPNDDDDPLPFPPCCPRDGYRVATYGMLRKAVARYREKGSRKPFRLLV